MTSIVRLSALPSERVDPLVVESEAAGHTPAPRVGRVRHLYVALAARRLGLGERLMEAIIEAAREPFDALRLSTNNPAAARLYERTGFSPTPGVEHCTHRMALR